MSSSSEYSGVSGVKAAKSPEKSTFSQTCSLLSQYLKEKGSFGDLTLGITRTTTETNGSRETSCHSATTMDLFPTKENNVKPQNLTTMDLLYPHGRHSAEEVPTLVKSSAFKCVGKEGKAAQLTIFYGGQVMVFDDFPAEKVEEIMSLAGKGVSQGNNHNSSAHAYTSQGHHYLSQPPSSRPPIVGDLPIARKLHSIASWRRERIELLPKHHIKPAILCRPLIEQMNLWHGLD